MSYYKAAKILAIIGLVLQLTVFLSPNEYFILAKHAGVIKEGVLFPVVLISWSLSCIAGAFNFIYIERLHMEYYIPVHRTKKIMPAILCTPAALSFFWFCFKIIS